jgi:hypothetical protein
VSGIAKTKTPFAQAQLPLAQTASLDQASSRRRNVRVRAGEQISLQQVSRKQSSGIEQ